mmetsp:Transcript_26765/g.63607  ORF Transcript_26765/g.63607 Transcript_26765/m.63607 type:complete len:334 (-) Transcript_26765:1190-2191(-)
MTFRALSVMRSKSWLELRPSCTKENCELKVTSSIDITLSIGFDSPISASSCNRSSSFFSETTLSRILFWNFSICAAFFAVFLSVLECSSRAFSSACCRISLNPNATRSHIPRSKLKTTAGNRSCRCSVHMSRNSFPTCACGPRLLPTLSSSSASSPPSPSTILFPSCLSALVAAFCMLASAIQTTSSPLTSFSYATASGRVTNWKFSVKNLTGSSSASRSARALTASPSFARRTTPCIASQSDSESLGSNFRFAGMLALRSWPRVRLARGWRVSSFSAPSKFAALWSTRGRTWSLPALTMASGVSWSSRSMPSLYTCRRKSTHRSQCCTNLTS